MSAPKLVDANGDELLSEREQRTLKPDWLELPPEEWPIAFVPSQAQGQPDKLILGGAEHPMRATVLIEREVLLHIPVSKIIELAGGAYAAIAKQNPSRAIAELIARAWIQLVNNYLDEVNGIKATLVEQFKLTPGARVH